MSIGAENLTIPVMDLNVTGLWGTQFLGNLLGSAFWGISVLHIIWYFLHRGNDSLLLKVYLFALFCIGTGQVCVCSASSYVVLIQHYGDLPFMKTTSRLGIVGAFSYNGQAGFSDSIQSDQRMHHIDDISYGSKLLHLPNYQV